MHLCSHVKKAEDPFCIISCRPSLDIISPLEALITITAGIPRTPNAEFNCLKSRINIKISLEFQSIRDQFISCTIPVSFNNMSFLEARESWPSSNMDFVRNELGTNELLPVELFFSSLFGRFSVCLQETGQKVRKKSVQLAEVHSSVPKLLFTNSML